MSDTDGASDNDSDEKVDYSTSEEGEEDGKEDGDKSMARVLQTKPTEGSLVHENSPRRILPKPKARTSEGPKISHQVSSPVPARRLRGLGLKNVCKDDGGSSVKNAKEKTLEDSQKEIGVKGKRREKALFMESEIFQDAFNNTTEPGFYDEADNNTTPNIAPLCLWNVHGRPNKRRKKE